MSHNCRDGSRKTESDSLRGLLQIIQVKDNSGLDQTSNGRDYEKRLDSRFILKIELTRFADLLVDFL